MFKAPSKHPTQAGGITILVALMLLVLLTIAAVSMSRNAFREVVISASARQGAMARDIADSGEEWGIYYVNALKTPDTTSSQNLQTLATTLARNNTAGIAYDIYSQAAVALPNSATPQADLQVPAASGNGMNIALTLMGKMPMPGTSQGAGTPGSGYTPGAGSTSLTAPDIWAIRSDSQVNTGSVTFQHSKEVWLSTPPR